MNHEAPVPSHTGNYYHVCISAKLDMRYLFRGKLDILRRIRFQFRYLLEDLRYCFGRCLDILTLEAGFPPTLGLVPLATLPALGERIVATALACDNIYKKCRLELSAWQFKKLSLTTLEAILDELGVGTSFFAGVI